LGSIRRCTAPPKIEEAITGALGLDALRLLTRLLYEAAVIGQKICVDPVQDYGSRRAADYRS
jgi:hypothetical protein